MKVPILWAYRKTIINFSVIMIVYRHTINIVVRSDVFSERSECEGIMGKKKVKDEYYHIDELLSHNANYSIVYGERSNGKSYSAKDFALKHFIDTGMKFIYLRRFESDITRALTNQYLSDSSVTQLFGETKFLKGHAGNIYVSDAMEDKELKEPDVHVGYIRSLNNAQRYSSGSYLDVDIIIYEEFVSLKGQYFPASGAGWLPGGRDGKAAGCSGREAGYPGYSRKIPL